MYWVVLSRPEFEFDFQDGFVPSEPISNRLYRGAGRDCWCHFYYHSDIMKNRKFYSSIRTLCGVEVVDSGTIPEIPKSAIDLEHEEVCWIRDAPESSSDTSFGIDVVSPFARSLIYNYLERYPNGEHIKDLNSNLLFDSAPASVEFIKTYRDLAEKEEVESLGPDQKVFHFEIGPYFSDTTYNPLAV